MQGGCLPTLVRHVDAVKRLRGLSSSTRETESPTVEYTRPQGAMPQLNAPWHRSAGGRRQRGARVGADGEQQPAGAVHNAVRTGRVPGVWWRAPATRPTARLSSTDHPRARADRSPGTLRPGSEAPKFSVAPGTYFADTYFAIWIRLAARCRRWLPGWARTGKPCRCCPAHCSSSCRGCRSAAPPTSGPGLGWHIHGAFCTP